MISKRRTYSENRSSRKFSLAAASAAFAIVLQNITRATADDHLDYRYENYAEDSHRIEVENHSVLLEADLQSWLSVKGNLVYDAISGQTPTGAPQNSADFLAHMRDTRRAADVAPEFKYGRQTLTPELSYSKESDYKSIGVSLGYSIDFNEKNTTLNFGVSRDFDQVIYTPAMALIDPGLIGQTAHKYSSDILVGVNQLLGPKTVLTVNGSFGADSGDLNDPYRGVYFEDNGVLNPLNPSVNASLAPEIRPRHRTKEIGFVSLTHYFSGLSGSLDGSYKFYHDSYGIVGHTVSLSWFQKLGKQVVVSPSFRFYTQTAANFYYPTVPANVEDPNLVNQGLTPAFLNGLGAGYNITQGPSTYYSADYRLAEFNSYTLGLGVTWKFWKHGSLDGSFSRYIMQGTDGVTTQALFPNANIFTVGLRFWL